MLPRIVRPTPSLLRHPQKHSFESPALPTHRPPPPCRDPSAPWCDGTHQNTKCSHPQGPNPFLKYIGSVLPRPRSLVPRPLVKCHDPALGRGGGRRDPRASQSRGLERWNALSSGVTEMDRNRAATAHTLADVARGAPNACMRCQPARARVSSAQRYKCLWTCSPSRVQLTASVMFWPF